MRPRPSCRSRLHTDPQFLSLSVQMLAHMMTRTVRHPLWHLCRCCLARIGSHSILPTAVAAADVGVARLLDVVFLLLVVSEAALVCLPMAPSPRLPAQAPFTGAMIVAYAAKTSGGVCVGSSAAVAAAAKVECAAAATTEAAADDKAATVAAVAARAAAVQVR